MCAPYPAPTKSSTRADRETFTGEKKNLNTRVFRSASQSGNRASRRSLFDECGKLNRVGDRRVFGRGAPLGLRAPFSTSPNIISTGRARPRRLYRRVVVDAATVRERFMRGSRRRPPPPDRAVRTYGRTRAASRALPRFVGPDRPTDPGTPEYISIMNTKRPRPLCRSHNNYRRERHVTAVNRYARTYYRARATTRR